MKHETIVMTAGQLGIHPREHEGLRALERDLAEGRIPHGSYADRPDLEPTHDEADGDAVAFNMAHSCGTACCIAGHLDARGQLCRRMYEVGNPLFALFYPVKISDLGFREWVRTCDPITPVQGAAAIRNFLASGDPRWHDILKELKLC